MYVRSAQALSSEVGSERGHSVSRYGQVDAEGRLGDGVVIEVGVGELVEIAVCADSTGTDES
jgi:hypothetical protein